MSKCTPPLLHKEGSAPRGASKLVARSLVTSVASGGGYRAPLPFPGKSFLKRLFLSREQEAILGAWGVSGEANPGNDCVICMGIPVVPSHTFLLSQKAWKPKVKEGVVEAEHTSIQEEK